MNLFSVGLSPFEANIIYLIFFRLGKLCFCLFRYLLKMCFTFSDSESIFIWLNLWIVQYRVSQKKGNPFYQWDIFIVAQVFIELYASCSRAFSILSFDTKHMTISQYMTEKLQFELMHVKIGLRRIMVWSWYDQVQTSYR